MAVHQGFVGDGAKRQPQAAGLGLANQELAAAERNFAEAIKASVETEDRRSRSS